jgi:hypothetical protein
LREKVKRKRPELWHNHNWLHHDNMPAHTSLKTTEFVTNNNMVIIPHPPKLKMKLKERHFETVSDIQRELQAVLDSIKENDFHSAFEA